MSVKCLGPNCDKLRDFILKALEDYTQWEKVFEDGMDGIRHKSIPILIWKLEYPEIWIFASNKKIHDKFIGAGINAPIAKTEWEDEILPQVERIIYRLWTDQQEKDAAKCLGLLGVE